MGIKFFYKLDAQRTRPPIHFRPAAVPHGVGEILQLQTKRVPPSLLSIREPLRNMG